MSRRRGISLVAAAVLLVGATALASGCGGGGDPAGPAAVEPVDIQAEFDTDMAASAALQERLERAFGMAPDLERVESTLAAEDFFCGPDPGEPSETACFRERLRGTCLEASLVRTRPWRPDQAQVVVICEPGQSPEAKPQP